MRITITDEMIEEKVESLRSVGQLTPLLVTPFDLVHTGVSITEGDGAAAEHLRLGRFFEIIDGHCRYIASELVPIDPLSCMVFLDVGEAKHAMMLHAGICATRFTAYEEGVQFIQLADKHGWTLEQLCKTFQRSENYICDRTDLVAAAPEIGQAVHARQLSLSRAKEIMRTDDATLRAYLMDQALVHGASTGTLRTMRHNWDADQARAAGAPHPNDAAFARAVDPPPLPACIWCGVSEDQSNIRSVPVHWYHEKEVRAICDQVGVKGLIAQNKAAGGV